MLPLAEVIAAAALTGEISLAAAISSCDRVSSHERFGRKSLVGRMLKSHADYRQPTPDSRPMALPVSGRTDLSTRYR